MASSGTFTSGRYGNSSVGPYLTLAWTQVSQSVANNTTTLDLTLRFHWSASIGLTFYNRAGTLQGHSYTYSGSVSGTSGSRVLRTQRVTISHNSNGARSITLSGNITNLGLTYSGNRVNTMSVSGTANLNTIPRASTLSKFSFNANLKNGTANRINYTVDKKSTGFRHHIQLRDGNTVLRTWDNQSSDGDSTLTLTASEVNTLLNRMSSSTTRSYTLRVRTRSGNNGSWIGSAVSRNATATVHADVKPTVGSVSLSQTGNPVTTHTLQGFSKIKASFTRSAGYGATISSSSIQVRRRSGGADSQTINSNDGTTSNPVSLHGVYEARGTARDSRGRTTHTSWATITVTQYSAPTITNFSAARNDSEPEKVDISRRTTHTVLGTSNHLTYTIQRRQGDGAWSNVSSGATGTVTTSGATGSATSTGNTVTQSYEFRLVVTDKLGRRAESISNVTTQRVVLDVHKNEGVGIGKIHERGVLDVDGGAYFTGDVNIIDVDTGNYGSVYINPPPTDNAYRGLYFRDSDPLAQGELQFRIAQYTSDGVPRELYVGEFGNAPNSIQFFKGESVPRIGGNPIIDQGMNENGYWVKYFDGTQICYKNDSNYVASPNSDMGNTGIRFTNRVLTFAKSFVGRPAISTTNVRETQVQWTGIRNSTSTYVDIYIYGYGAFRGSVGYIAIGRWK